MSHKKEKLAIEKETDRYIELCTVDMNKAADMLKEKSEIERIQMNVILQENVEKENGRIKIYSFLTFSITILSLVMTILTFINNISLEKNKKTLTGAGTTLVLITIVASVAILGYAILTIGEIIQFEKKTKYVRALAYLRMLEQNEFYNKTTEQTEVSDSKNQVESDKNLVNGEHQIPYTTIYNNHNESCSNLHDTTGRNNIYCQQQAITESEDEEAMTLLGKMRDAAPEE
ncbi:unknown [Roseburia sp. CAG:471]|nr:unknown [Roseburia sp. CAG:471]